jgi:hypothetical protein
MEITMGIAVGSSIVSDLMLSIHSSHYFAANQCLRHPATCDHRMDVSTQPPRSMVSLKREVFSVGKDLTLFFANFEVSCRNQQL